MPTAFDWKNQLIWCQMTHLAKELLSVLAKMMIKIKELKVLSIAKN